MLNGSKENCTFSKTHINEVIRFLANTARYSPPTFFTMESTKYKTGSFSADGAWSNRELNKFRTQQGLKPTFQNKYFNYNLTGLTGPTALPLTTHCVKKVLIKKCGDVKNQSLCQGRKRCKDSAHLHKKGEKAIQRFLHPGLKIKQRKNTSIKSFAISLRVRLHLRSVKKKRQKNVEKSSIMISQIRVCKYGSQEAHDPFSESGENKKTCPWRVKKRKKKKVKSSGRFTSKEGSVHQTLFVPYPDETSASFSLQLHTQWVLFTLLRFYPSKCFSPFSC